MPRRGSAQGYWSYRRWNLAIVCAVQRSAIDRKRAAVRARSELFNFSRKTRMQNVLCMDVRGFVFKLYSYSSFLMIEIELWYEKYLFSEQNKKKNKKKIMINERNNFNSSITCSPHGMASWFVNLPYHEAMRPWGLVVYQEWYTTKVWGLRFRSMVFRTGIPQWIWRQLTVHFSAKPFYATKLYDEVISLRYTLHQILKFTSIR